MNKIFKQVSLKEEGSYYPKKKGYYSTSMGEVRFENGHWWGGRGWIYPDWWLEEIELPSDNEIYRLGEEIHEGAKWMRDFVLAGEAVAPLTSNTNSH